LLACDTPNGGFRLTIPAKLYTRKTAPFTFEEFQKDYHYSISNPEEFWAEKAKLLHWDKPYDTVLEGSFEAGNFSWFTGGKLNACYNCVDRHLEEHADDIAMIWEGNEPTESETLTYQELHSRVCQFSNALKSRGIKKGDRVCLYMPMLLEAGIAMLACARIGAIHSVVFGGFSPEALANRILDSDCQAIITADEGLRGTKKIPLKENVDLALKQCSNVHSVFVVKHSGAMIAWNQNRDVWYHEITQEQSTDSHYELMEANDPLFILYTSGSTGKPKGVVHSTAGYLLYTMLTFQIAFDYQPGDVYWCTADVGWITGHSYMVYGPLANRATTLFYAGVPNYPDYSRFWQIVDKHRVTIFYTAPTAIRAIMAAGDENVLSSDRSSLKILGTVGEPINPEVWEWYFKVVGNSRCPIIDTWWQTETGGFMLTPIAGITDMKPGSATLPFYGVKPSIIDGTLYIDSSWPGQMITVFGDHERFKDTYFSQMKGKFFTGDAAEKDDDGFYWITGRVDDVINISGHRIGTAEIESALVEDPRVVEAAAIGFPDEIKGESIYAFVSLIKDVEVTDSLFDELTALVKKHIGSFAKPEKIQFVIDLPKTRSGKIMRRILRKIVNHQADELGDISTLADPSVVESIIAGFE
jgi:acetyl-CoA synthetase